MRLDRSGSAHRNCSASGVFICWQGEIIVNFSISMADSGDAGDILALQKVAYQSEATLYQNWTIPPLMQTLSEIEAEFGTGIFLKAILEGRIVGSVRGSLRSGKCLIGRLIVYPHYQGKGIGTALMKSLEKAFPEADRFEPFTGNKSMNNIRLYERLGYEAYREEDLSLDVRLVFMEKQR